MVETGVVVDDVSRHESRIRVASLYSGHSMPIAVND